MPGDPIASSSRSSRPRTPFRLSGLRSLRAGLRLESGWRGRALTWWLLISDPLCDRGEQFDAVHQGDLRPMYDPANFPDVFRRHLGGVGRLEQTGDDFRLGRRLDRANQPVGFAVPSGQSQRERSRWMVLPTTGSAVRIATPARFELVLGVVLSPVFATGPLYQSLSVRLKTH